MDEEHKGVQIGRQFFEHVCGNAMDIDNTLKEHGCIPLEAQLAVITDLVELIQWSTLTNMMSLPGIIKLCFSLHSERTHSLIKHMIPVLIEQGCWGDTCLNKVFEVIQSQNDGYFKNELLDVLYPYRKNSFDYFWKQSMYDVTMTRLNRREAREQKYAFQRWKKRGPVRRSDEKIE